MGELVKNSVRVIEFSENNKEKLCFGFSLLRFSIAFRMKIIFLLQFSAFAGLKSVIFIFLLGAVQSFVSCSLSFRTSLLLILESTEFQTKSPL